LWVRVYVIFIQEIESLLAVFYIRVLVLVARAIRNLVVLNGFAFMFKKLLILGQEFTAQGYILAFDHMHVDDALFNHLESYSLPLLDSRFKFSTTDENLRENSLKRVFSIEFEFFYNTLVLDYTSRSVD
jgi:hypothetical protein